MLYKLSQLSDLPIRDNEISLLVDSHDYMRNLNKLALLDKIHLYTLDDFLMETLELAGSLRELGVVTSINDLPESKEEKLMNDNIYLNVNITELNKETTWNIGSNIFLSDNKYIIGKDFPIPDPRTGIIGNILRKNKVVIFRKIKENEGIGELIGGKYDGEKLLIRPNRWLSDLSVINIKRNENNNKIISDVRELFCRPLGSAYIPVTEDELFSVLIKFNMRAGGFPKDCYKVLGWLD
ncbi:hypothetical protein [Acidianus manzaensis]|uniref:Uncharacterized protein n=1 Tax=Acidianus manzaensis TaxID=282676 RepID=A0A1W6JX05_9CREN|nr:hypothetical protein [Acidianus manzaensis]ARM74779.1 hypothetical protein B6F84_01225 [Acidianus manzaensis]